MFQEAQQYWSVQRASKQNVSLGAALRHATRGVVAAMAREANLRRQVMIGIGTAILGAVLRISSGEFMVIGLAAALVVTLELINSAIESLADAISPTYNAHIQSAKDIASGAVLVGSVAALIVGFVVLFPPLLALVGF